MHKDEFSVGFPNSLNDELKRFLLRDERKEDLVFALWSPSDGERRLTALLHTIVYPQAQDREQHGNVSFNSSYVERAAALAAKQKCGLAMLHSHVGPGWQDMSSDDFEAEKKWAGTIETLTELPFFGLTVSTDNVWSARMWKHVGGRDFKPIWCRNVRSAGLRLKIDFADLLEPRPTFQEMFKRTRAVFGEQEHQLLSRLRIGIVGLGSVGSLVAETLARMGMQSFVLIDFDEVQSHNLDRLVTAIREDVGKLKVDVAAARIRASATAANVEVRLVPFSVVEERGYRAALDCDVLFSCVDRPRARKILNHIAFAHLIPVIDGGIGVTFKNGRFSHVDWQVQTVAPTRPCLECIGQFTSDDAWTEEAGMLEDPPYLKGLLEDHRLKRNENVFLFSENVASLEVLQLVDLCLAIGGIDPYGIQRFRSNVGTLEYDIEKKCNSACGMANLVARGDQFALFGRDRAAEAARTRQAGQR